MVERSPTSTIQLIPANGMVLEFPILRYEEMLFMSIDFDLSENSTTASVLNDFTRHDAERMNDMKLSRLIMRTPSWSGGGLEYLRYAESVKYLKIFCHTHIDISVLSESPQLEQILVYGIPSGKFKINELPDISALSLNLQSSHKLKLYGLSSSQSLRVVEGNIGAAYFDELTELHGLRFLNLRSSRVTELTFLNSINDLIGISLREFSGLVDLSGLLSSTKLKFLKILGSRKISTYQVFSSLRNLEVLMFDDCAPIDSLDCLRMMDNLGGVSFSGDTCVRDGKLSMLNEMKNIRYVNFVDRKHYDSVSEDFPSDFDWMSLACTKYQPSVA